MTDSAVMIVQPYYLYIERTDPRRNMARYYSMQISMTLFGDTCLTRRWGRIGTHGRTMVHHFHREEDAVRLFLDLTREKRARGYRPRTTDLSKPDAVDRRQPLGQHRHLA